MTARSTLLLAFALAACAEAPEPASASEAERSPAARGLDVRLWNATGMTISRIDVHPCTEAGDPVPPARDLLAGEPLAAGAERAVSLPAGCHFARPRYDDGSPNGLEVGEKILVRDTMTHRFGLG